LPPRDAGHTPGVTFLALAAVIVLLIVGGFWYGWARRS
jgi:hypothetical protein